VLVAVSGGADSVALLRLLLELRGELGAVLAVAHFNHGLRGESSDADEHFVVNLAGRYKLDCSVEHANVAEYAAARRLSLETAGRELRYEWLAKIAHEQRFDAVATAHTLDDQAETVLMKFLRGAGSKGLAGIFPEMTRDDIRFIRPLLSSTRAEVEAYLSALAQPWREDESNLDHRFRRNRLRHELLPLLEREYNPNVRELLSEAAEINRAEEAYWNRVTSDLLASLRADPQRLRVRDFAELQIPLQRRLLKRWLEEAGLAIDFQHIERLRACALGEVHGTELSINWIAERQGDCVVLKKLTPEAERPAASGYSHVLPIPGEVRVPEAHLLIRAVPVPASFAAEADPGTLVRAELLGTELCVRNWCPGDRYHPAYSASEQKLKRLFSEHHIPAEERSSWPVVLKGYEIVWAGDLRVADSYCWREGDGDAIRIDCISV
jgi:tRNA(Ile)-lysidine synthase